MARGNRIALMMSSLGKIQTDMFTPLDVADLDLRLSLTSRNWVETAKTIEDIFDCVGEELVGREVTRIIRRLPVEGEFTAFSFAPIAANAYGVAASPTGSSANKIVTVTIVNATGGYFKLTLNYDGINQTTANIPHNATARQFQRAIEELDNIGYGNSTVALAGGVYTVEFTGKRANANVPLFTPVTTDLTGVGADVTVAQTQAGGQLSHNIAENAGYAQKLTTFGIAFEDEPGSERLMVGASTENFVVTGAANNGKVTFSADIVSRDLITEPTLVVPPCVNNLKPIRTADCALVRNSVALTDKLREFTYSFNNNTLTANSAYTGRGVKPTRLDRANQRSRSLAYTLLGASSSVTDSLYEEADNNPEAFTVTATSLRVGTDGDNLTFNIPDGLTQLATGSGGLGFDNESEEALIRLVDTPTKAGGVAPTNLVIKSSQTGTFLTPA